MFLKRITKMNFLKIIYIPLIIMCFFGCKKDSATNSVKSIEDYLVKNNEITGWTYSGSGWTANNLSELTTYIDGAADIYQRHGFVEAVNQQYQGNVNNNQCTLKITIYNQGNKSNAQATYNDNDIGLSGAIIWQSGAGDEVHYVRYGGLSQVMTFYRNAFFVYLEINTDSEESLNILKQFSLNIDGKLK
jgi:hypothetical protein